MNIAVIGATGFVGRAVVRCALGRGWRLTAVARQAVRRLRDPEHSQLVAVDADVTRTGPPLGGVDVAVYAPALASCSEARAAMEHTVRALAHAGVGRVVVVGSLSVLDYDAIADGSVVEESAPVARDFASRDEYARIKFEEESGFLRRAAETGTTVSILRVGAVVGPGRLWTARLGFRFGQRWVRVSSKAELPIVHMDDAAEVVCGVAASEGPPRVLHVVHGQPPTQQEYVAMTTARGLLTKPLLTVPAGIVRGASRIGGALTPMSVARFDARFKTVRYSGAAAKPYCPRLAQRTEEVLERCVIA